MAKCFLGPKKVKKIEQALGFPILGAMVRGGHPHFHAEVWYEEDGRQKTLGFNYKTMEIFDHDYWGQNEKKTI